MHRNHIGGYVEYTPSYNVMRAIMRWFFLLAIGGAIYLLLSLEGCRASTPIVQLRQNVSMTCQVVSSDIGGNVTLDCRADGHKPNAPIDLPGDGPTTNVVPARGNDGGAKIFAPSIN